MILGPHHHHSSTTTNFGDMSNVNFTDIEKQAMIASNNINVELGINDEVFQAGLALNADYAIEVVKKMDTDRKCFVARLLVRIMDADGASESEHDLLEYIGQRIGLDKELGC